MKETSRVRSERSALAQAGFAQPGFQTDALSFCERAEVSKIRVRASGTASTGLPTRPGLPDVTGQCLGRDPAFLCLRPGEWLTVSESDSAETLMGEIVEQYGDSGVLTWDESDGLAALRLEGPAAPWLLAKHCGLDLHGARPDAEYCAQVRYAHIRLLLHYRGDADGGIYDLYVDRGLARWLWESMADSAPHAIELFKTRAARGRVQS